ncbi:ComF family protein [Nesterenkonia ebinurensis]|uniref:ComF family protein n=1 Tax=Nesterenkonia ebinurensis TaxID=2608252 RepID=UPI00123D6F8F|nr:phosphoribosyltransferase family protein [Nesterenkonia ebinurensis]
MTQYRERLLSGLDRLWFSPSGQAVRRLAKETTDLLAPTWCVGCRAAGADLCAECARDLRLHTSRPFRAEAAAEALPVVGVSDTGVQVLPVVSAGHYQGLAAETLVAFKDHERTGLAQVLAPALSRALHLAAQQLLEGQDALLVWPPTSPRAQLKRGRTPLAELIEEARLPRSLRRADRLVQHTGQRLGPMGEKGQKSRSGKARRQAGERFRCRPAAAQRLRGVSVLLVDDVLTTGATLQELYALLSSAGAEVHGAAVLMATPRASAARHHSSSAVNFK